MDIANVNNWLQGIDKRIELMGIWSYGIIFLLRSISIVIPILPGTYCSVLSGYFFGFEKGLIIIFMADMLSCTSSFFISRQFGREFIKKLVGKKLMYRVEDFSQQHLEKNFFLMTSFLMSNFFDFVCYGIGLTKVPWKKFMPALVFSILISDAPFVASGMGLKQLGGIEIEEILNGNIKSIQGFPLWIFIGSVTVIFSLALINIYAKNRRNKIKS